MSKVLKGGKRKQSMTQDEARCRGADEKKNSRISNVLLSLTPRLISVSLRLQNWPMRVRESTTCFYPELLHVESVAEYPYFYFLPYQVMVESHSKCSGQI